MAKVIGERLVTSGIERHVPIEPGTNGVVNAREECPEAHEMASSASLEVFEDRTIGADHSLLESGNIHAGDAIEPGTAEPEAPRELPDP